MKNFLTFILLAAILVSCTKESNDPTIGNYKVNYITNTSLFDPNGIDTGTTTVTELTIEVIKNENSDNQYFIMFPGDNTATFEQSTVSDPRYNTPLIDENYEIIPIVQIHYSLSGYIKDGKILIEEYSGCCGNYYSIKIEGEKLN